VKWNCSGSSVLRLTLRPVRKKVGNGLRSYARKRALFESGDMAICRFGSSVSRRASSEERAQE